jgi:hypothetical protein
MQISIRFVENIAFLRVNLAQIKTRMFDPKWPFWGRRANSGKTISLFFSTKTWKPIFAGPVFSQTREALLSRYPFAEYTNQKMKGGNHAKREKSVPLLLLSLLIFL